MSLAGLLRAKATKDDFVSALRALRVIREHAIHTGTMNDFWTLTDAAGDLEAFVYRRATRDDFDLYEESKRGG